MFKTATPRPTEGAALAERIRRKAKLYAAISGIRISRPRPIATEVR